MSKLTKALMLLFSAVFMLGLTACGDTLNTTSGAYDEVTVTLKDGRQLPCIKGAYALECDWDNAKKF